MVGRGAAGLAEGAEVEDGATVAGRVFGEAGLLAVEHQGLVVVVNLLRRRVGGELGFEQGVRGADLDARGDQPEARGDAVVVAVDGEGREAEAAEQEDRGARLRADPRQVFQPGAGLRHREFGQETAQLLRPTKIAACSR